jgi:hypothetical protein
MSKQKYKKGLQIKNIDSLIKQEFIYHHDKVLHAGWFLSWSIHFAIKQIAIGTIFYAIKINESEDRSK